ncbi:GATA transcription factor 5-like [Magnolia sinica]|uniref:GATA transcription factor 5-like n=1 Tax=Magnolia sinica TaxID=86752 RepID=UPI00265A243C|nr:GATA transcription factor 5-like [Magnolia sinica]XP_058109184.1 GATA transcription factor 5-like [Magnolia sinica]
MECVEAAAALKASLRAEMLAVRSWAQDQSSNDDDWCGNGAAAGGDEFFVDGLLDFSNEDGVGGLEEEEEEKNCSVSVSTADDNSNSHVSVKDDFEAGIGVPTDDLADLEWLSHFVEESFTEFPCSTDSLPYTWTATKNPTTGPDKKSPSPDQKRGFVIGINVPAKARSKRARTSTRVWSFSSPQTTESSTSSSSSASSSSNSSLTFCNTAQNLDLYYGKQPYKKKKPAVPVKDRKSPVQQPQRRCSHCLVQKTPQWRTGPLGSKTLCNACGVRYKSGRLLPEYRPAGSPTFMSHVHSNHHRRVLEMRQRKEVSDPHEPGLPAVESF